MRVRGYAKRLMNDLPGRTSWAIWRKAADMHARGTLFAPDGGDTVPVSGAGTRWLDEEISCISALIDREAAGEDAISVVRAVAAQLPNRTFRSIAERWRTLERERRRAGIGADARAHACRGTPWEAAELVVLDSVLDLRYQEQSGSDADVMPAPAGIRPERSCYGVLRKLGEMTALREASLKGVEDGARISMNGQSPAGHMTEEVEYGGKMTNDSGSLVHEIEPAGASARIPRAGKFGAETQWRVRGVVPPTCLPTAAGETRGEVRRNDEERIGDVPCERAFLLESILESCQFRRTPGVTG